MRAIQPLQPRGTARGASVAIVGAGNIGSHVAPLVGRLRGVRRVLLVDPKKYDEANLISQSINPGEIGKGKAQVQAIRLKRINPALDVEGLGVPVEAVPLGRLRADIILSCVDNRAARQYLNHAARRLGVTWIDSGVQADGGLARVSVFRCGPESACLECSWDQADYDAIEQRYPCQSGSPATAATNAPAHLGALAAAMQVAECQRLIVGEPGRFTESHEVILDTASHRHHVTRFLKTQACRLPHHDSWVIRRLAMAPEDLTVDDAISLHAVGGQRDRVSLWLDGLPFVARLTCLGCGVARSSLRLRRSTGARDRVCRSCGGRLEAVGADVIDRLEIAALATTDRNRSLRSLGLDTGDVFSVSSGSDTRHYELVGHESLRGRRAEV